MYIREGKEGTKMKKDIMRLSKNTLICYLLNELDNATFEVTTHLTEDGCWTGAIDIRFAEGPDNDDVEYFKALAAHF